MNGGMALGEGVKRGRKETLEVGGVHNLICMHELNRAGLGRGGGGGQKKEPLHVYSTLMCIHFYFIKCTVLL